MIFSEMSLYNYNDCRSTEFKQSKDFPASRKHFRLKPEVISFSHLEGQSRNFLKNASDFKVNFRPRLRISGLTRNMPNPIKQISSWFRTFGTQKLGSHIIKAVYQNVDNIFK